MKTVFTIRGYLAFSEKDNFENGCSPESAKTEFMSEREWSITADSIQCLVDQLSAEFAAEKITIGKEYPYNGPFIFDSCDEPGRLDIQVHQTRPFQIGKLSEKTIAEWKEGKRDMWLTFYSFTVEGRVIGCPLSTFCN